MSTKKIAFIHPDLGIGGAERLVVDAAVGLVELGETVKIFTSHCDKTHCFEEVSNGFLNVQVYGDFLPTNMMKKFHILCAILRQFYLVLKLVSTREILDFDYFIIDQLSFCIPILVLFKRPDARILFYCHFPDQLLSKPAGTLKKLYRKPFDYIEEYTTGLSDRIVVNSNFTKSVFHHTFNINTDPNVIYPCVDIDQAVVETSDDEVAEKEITDFLKHQRFFVSINRFERKKNIGLAIKAFKLFRNGLKSAEIPKLIIAGGFDARVRENVEYLNELEALAKSLDLKSSTIRGKLIISPPNTDILFLPSIKSSVKNALIRHSDLLLYTPSHEHFGIVPVESMLFQTPVLAANNGGPLESVLNYYDDPSTATGFNVSLEEDKWAETMSLVYEKGSSFKQELGSRGFKWVLKQFLRHQMSVDFLENLVEAQDNPDKGNFIKLMKLLISIKYIILVVILGILLRSLA